MTTMPKKIGIVAGGGTLPQRLLNFCANKNIETFVVAFDGQTDQSILNGHDHIVTRIGAAGNIIKTLKQKSVVDLCLIGSMKRPKLLDMRPDFRTATFFAKLGFRALGDDGLLKVLRKELEDEGFLIHGIHELMDGIIMPKGVLSSMAPSDDDWENIRIGLNAAYDLGEADIGQSVVVCNEDVVGTEDEAGTDELIKRTAYKGAILVKSAKPGQDRKLDLPTIGLKTIHLCASLGYSGIAVQAGDVLLADEKQAMIECANEHSLFWVGV